MKVSWSKLKKDIRKKYDAGELLPIYTLGRQWTPEEIIEAVENDTNEGLEFLMAEKKLQDELKRLSDSD